MTELSGEGGFPLSRVPRPKLAEAAASRILDGIRTGRLKPGARIPSERELMSGLGVGRSTVREAINGLAMLGMLEIRHGQGVFVADPRAGGGTPLAMFRSLTRGGATGLLEARRLIEPEVARLAAQRRTSADVSRIADALADHERAIKDGEPTVEPAVSFHLRIAEAAHNEILVTLVEALREPLLESGPLLEALPGYRDWEIEQHRSVFEPIRTGAPDLAADRMRTHLAAVASRHEQLDDV